MRVFPGSTSDRIARTGTAPGSSMGSADGTSAVRSISSFPAISTNVAPSDANRSTFLVKAS